MAVALPKNRPLPALRAASTVVLALLLALAVGGCAGGGGPQSTLAPASPDAERIASLWWTMAVGAVVVWVLVVGIAVYAIRVRPGPHDERRTTLLIIGGGTVLPTVVLGALLLVGLPTMPRLLEPGEDGLRVHVSGEEWWWRVKYVTEDGDTVELANEIRLPVGRRTEFVLSSPDVIHSFWIPPLGGKTDMIPGRITRTALEPHRTGTFRGACAEYCGTSHAYMNLVAVVMEPEDFAGWLEEQARPASAPEAGSRGRDAFLAHGCGACHTVRGTPAEGRVGPDLTHVGSRESLAAGRLPMSEAALRRWIARAPEIKPGVHMPSYEMLPEAEIAAMAAWLAGLR